MLGHIHSHSGLHEACGLQAGHPCLEFRRSVFIGKEVEEEEGKGMARAVLQKQRVCAGAFVLRLLCFSCRWEFMGGMRGRFQ